MKIFGVVFMLPFIIVPLAMLAMVWDAGGFGAPPLAMQVAITAICLAVMSGGIFAMLKLVTAQAPVRDQGDRRARRHPMPAPGQQPAAQYACEHCGAGLSTDAEISPSGDVKCPFCKSWFNVRKS